MTTPNDWLTEKENLIAEFNQWLTGWTNTNPRPVELIDQLLEIKPHLEMANKAEFADWWQAVKTAACNDAPMPAH